MYLRTLILAAAMTSQAHASDLFEPKVEYETNALASEQTWTGGHIGLHMGIAKNSTPARLGRTDGALIALDVSNGLFPRSIAGDDLAPSIGLTAGYDYQMGNLVAGVGISGDLTGMKGFYGQNRRDPNPNPPFNGVQTIVGYHSNIDSYGSVTARVGYAAGNTLFFGTGGLAIGRVENRFTLHIPELAYNSPDWKSEGTQTGYTVGGGFETKLTSNMRLRVELQYYDLADATVVGVDPANFPGQRIDHKFENSFTVGKVGLVWGF